MGSAATNGLLVRFVTVKTRNPREDCVQLSQIILLANDCRLKVRKVTNAGGRNPQHEGPDNIIDGTTTTKWLDFRKQPLIMELENFSVVPDAYVLGTANDFPNRDPIRWRMESSKDGGSTWQILDDRSHSDQVVTHCRLATSQAFGLDQSRVLVRFVTWRTRNPSEDCVQLSQIILYANNRPLSIRNATNPGGSNPCNEGPENVMNGDTNKKWLDFRKKSLILELEDLPDSYVLVTANDFPSRDPIRWRMETTSDSGVTWRLLDDCSDCDQVVTLSRLTTTPRFVVAQEEPRRQVLVRFVTLQTRNKYEDCVQLSQILLFSNNTSLTYRAITNPGGRNPHNEGPLNLLDGTTRTKWLDFCKQPLVVELENRPDAYVLVTANDVPNRDPIRWRMESSIDGGVSWQMLDDRSDSDQDVPLSRLVASQVFGPAEITTNCVLPVSHVNKILSNQEQIAQWANPSTPRPAEYADTLSAICIVPELMGTSYMDDKIAILQKQMPKEPSFETVAARLVGRAFGIENLASARRYHGSGPGGIASRGNYFRACLSVYNDLDDWQRPLLHMALSEMLTHPPDSLAVMCGLLLRASQECMARKHHVFVVAIDRSVSNEVETEGICAVSTDLETHKRKLFAAAKMHIDELKDLAFKSTFTEPTKMYFRAVGDSTMEGDVDIHGSNTYLALLLAALGVKLAHSPLLDDEVKGVVPFLDALAPEDVQKLWDVRNPGKSWEAAIGRGSCLGVLRRVRCNEFVFHGTIARQVAEDCLKSSPRSRVMLKPYLDAFARYFSQDIVVERLCNYFLSKDEVRPSLQAIFCHVATKQEVLDAEKQVLYWLWGPMSGEFHQNRALALLRSAGICRADMFDID